MERAVAVKKLGKLLGKGMGYRVDLKAPTADEREEVTKQLPAVRAAREQAERALDERKRTLLTADPEYQTLLAAYRQARKHADEMFSVVHHYRFTVGTSNGMFFHIRAQGDSWEEVIEKVTK